MNMAYKNYINWKDNVVDDIEYMIDGQGGPLERKIAEKIFNHMMLEISSYTTADWNERMNEWYKENA